MIAESIISLLPIAISYTESLVARFPRGLRRSGAQEMEEDETEPPERLVPLSWVGIGLATSSVLGIVLVWVIFGDEGIRPWATALGLVLASILSVLGVRALGQTDLNPVVRLPRDRHALLYRSSVNPLSRELGKSVSWSLRSYSLGT